MEQWNYIPLVIRKKLIVTLLTGAGCFFITVVSSAVFRDRLLLYLGLTVTAGCLLRGSALWNTIRTRLYETVTGACIDINYPRLHRYKRVKLVEENGEEILLLLDRNTRVKAGECYRFYFQKYTCSLQGSEYLKASLSSGTFLGHEKIDKN